MENTSAARPMTAWITKAAVKAKTCVKLTTPPAHSINLVIFKTPLPFFMIILTIIHNQRNSEINEFFPFWATSQKLSPAQLGVSYFFALFQPVANLFSSQIYQFIFIESFVPFLASELLQNDAPLSMHLIDLL